MLSPKVSADDIASTYTAVLDTPKTAVFDAAEVPGSSPGRPIMISEQLKKVIACPVCKSDLKLENNKLVCTKCNRCYEIKKGIPVLLP